MKQILVAVALVMFGLMPGVSQAAPIFSDNFDGENGGVGDVLNYGGFANWAVGNGTVDLIGVGGSFDLIPLNGLYVDLDGTTNQAGIMQSTALLGLVAGTSYTLTFDLAGSQRGDSNTLTYGIETDGLPGLDHSVTLGPVGSGVPFGPISLIFTPTAPIPGAFIQFGQSGGDNIGLLMDNVALNFTPVPEPASLMLLGAGLAAIGIWRRKAAAKG